MMEYLQKSAFYLPSHHDVITSSLILTFRVSSCGANNLILNVVFWLASSSIDSPWYNRNGWLGVKHQSTHPYTDHFYIALLSDLYKLMRFTILCLTLFLFFICLGDCYWHKMPPTAQIHFNCRKAVTGLISTPSPSTFHTHFFKMDFSSVHSL